MTFNFPLPQAVVNARKLLHGREAPQGAGRPFSYSFRDSAGNELKRPALEGFACVFRKPFEYEGETVFFEQTAFAAAERTKAVDFLFDHQEGRAYGSTATGLEFASCLTGLAFRLPLAGPDGKAVADHVLSGDRSNLSVGCVFQKTEMQMIAGVKCRVIQSATLKEISLCREGKVPATAAWLTDLEGEEPNLWLACRKATFGRAKAAANVAARARRVAENLKQLQTEKNT